MFLHSFSQPHSRSHLIRYSEVFFDLSGTRFTILQRYISSSQQHNLSSATLQLVSTHSPNFWIIENYNIFRLHNQLSMQSFKNN